MIKKNLMLLLSSIFLIMAFGEWLFPKFIGKLPLRLYGLIDKDLRVLAQSSKKNQLPKDYIALTGDSYAIGAGDWLNEVRKSNFFGSPDYSAAHLIHKKTGIDVISFARAGAGSFDGIWSEPVSQFLYINSIRDYKLSPPKHLLIFFYEGNDIYDNIQFLRDNLLETEKEQAERIELKKIQDFLNAEFEKVLNRQFDNSIWKNMLFIRSILHGTSNLAEEWGLSNKQPKNKGLYNKVMPEGKGAFALIDGKKVQLNLAMMNGKKVGLPTHLQGPPSFALNNEERVAGSKDNLIGLSVNVFEQSLVRLASFFPQVKIKIIYIPSPVSSYKMVSSHIHFRGFMQDIDVMETIEIEKRHIKLCNTIKRVTRNHNFSFVNSTKSLKKATSTGFVHGPIDWDHFNKRGYQVLSEDLAELFLQTDESIRIDNCVY